PPAIFKMGFTPDKTKLLITVGDPLVANIRRRKSSYRIYFAPINLATPGRIGQPEAAFGVFQQSQLIDSVIAPQNGGSVTITDSIHVGLDGWFFATAMNSFNTESDFVGPIRNPIVGTNDSRVPPDMLDPRVDFSNGGVDGAGRQIVLVT